MNEALAAAKKAHPQLFRLAGYNYGKKVHAKQLEFHACKKRNRWVFGGNRTGKTECGAVETVWFARGIHPYRQISGPTDGWVVSLTSEVQRDVAQQKVLSYLPPEWIDSVVMKKGRQGSPESGVIDFITVKSVHGGISTIGFKSCDQGRARFQGTSLDYVWFDEEPPEDVYTECRMRVLDRRGDIWGTMTPLMGLTWVHNQIYLNSAGDPEVWHESMSWEDNPFLDPAELALMSNVLSPSARQTRQYGRFAQLCGLVYPEFDSNEHVIEPFDIPSEWQCRISIDPGLVNPLSAHWYAVDGDGNVYVVAEHFAAGRPVSWHADRIREISRGLNWKTDSAGRLEALIDSAAGQHTLNASKSVAGLFLDEGIAVNTAVDKNVWAGLQRVKQYLCAGQHPRLRIFSTCTELIREFKIYRFGQGDTPVKEDDHAMDELRYFIMSRPQAARQPDGSVNPIAADFERLARRKKYKRVGL